MANTDSRNHIGKTARHSATYAIGTIISRLTALVMLPIYTRYLTPEDYGVVELLTMALEVASILVGLRISQAMFRYYILEDDIAEKSQIVSTILITVLASSSVGAAVLFLSAEPLSTLIFGDAIYFREFQLFAFTLVTNAVTAVGLSYIRAKQKPVLFVLVSVFKLALQVALNVYFVVMLELHVTGVVYSALISGVIVAVVLAVYIFGNVGLQYSKTIAKRSLIYIAPLILASLGTFYVSYADKYFLRLFGGLAEVGLYALAFRISSILGTVFQSFNLSWTADRYEIVKQENARIVFSQVFRFLSAGMIMIGAALAIFANDFLRVMTNPDFYSAGNIVPILVLAVLTHIFTMFCNFGILLHEKTRHIAESSWVKVIIATFCYVMLIPYLGVYGAAGALLISNLIELYLVNKNATRLYDMGLQWRSVFMTLMIGVFCVGVTLILPVGELKYFVLRLAIFVGFATIVFYMPVWNPEDRELIRSAVRKVVGFSRA